MRVTVLAMAMATLLFPIGAYAESWKADLILIPEKSRSGCPQSGSTDPYVIDIADNHVTVSNVTKYFTIPMPADGKIQQKYKSPTGNQLEIVGNLMTKDLELVNERFACRWKLVPRGQ